MVKSKGRRWMMGIAAAYGALAGVAACTTTVLQAEAPGDGGTGDVVVGDAASGADGAGSAHPADAGGSEHLDAGRDGERPRDAAADAPLVDCGVQGQIFTSPLGPFCPFQAGGVFSNCAIGEHCCEYAEDASVSSICSAGATACGLEIATGFDWRCDEANDCPSGQVCCFAGAITPHLQCIGQYSASATTHSTACRIGTCAGGETRTCGSQADCPLGTTCTGMRLRGKHFGFCKP